jgi:ATP-binding cassette subfamily B protein
MKIKKFKIGKWYKTPRNEINIKKEIFFALLALLNTTLMVLFFGKSLKYLIDLGFVSKDSFWLNFILLIFFVAVAVMAIAGYYRSSIVNSVCEKVVCDLRKQIYAHVISVSAEFFEITKAGDVISRLTLDTLNLYNFVSNSISFCLRNLLLFIGGMVFLFITSPKLTLISLTLIIFALVPIILMGRKVKSLSSQSQNALAAVSSRIEESISGIRTIQAYLCEEKEIRSFSAFVENALNSSLEKIRVRSMMVAFVISIAFGSIAVVIWFGSHDILQGKMTSGDLTSFVF